MTSVRVFGVKPRRLTGAQGNSFKPIQKLSICEEEQATSARERRLNALQAHSDKLSTRQRTILTGLIEGTPIQDLATHLKLSIDTIMGEVKTLTAGVLDAPRMPTGHTFASGDSFEAVLNERLETRGHRYFPKPHAVPDSDGWIMLRLGECIKLGELEVWLLANIGPGNTGAIDLREATDRWQLGRRAGYWHLWLKYSNDYHQFLATWLTPQITSERIQ